MCLKLSFSYHKWVSEAILSFIVFSNYVFVGSNIELLFSLTVLNFVVFFRLLNRKFYEEFKNVLKTVIFSLQVGFTDDFVSDCPFKLCFCQFKL